MWVRSRRGAGELTTVPPMMAEHACIAAVVGGADHKKRLLQLGVGVCSMPKNPT